MHIYRTITQSFLYRSRRWYQCIVQLVDGLIDVIEGKVLRNPHYVEMECDWLFSPSLDVVKEDRL